MDKERLKELEGRVTFLEEFLLEYTGSPLQRILLKMQLKENKEIKRRNIENNP